MSSPSPQLLSIGAAIVIVAVVGLSVLGVSSADLATSSPLMQLSYPARVVLWATIQCILGFGTGTVIQNSYEENRGHGMAQFVAFLGSSLASYAGFFSIAALMAGAETMNGPAQIFIWGLVALFIDGYLLASNFEVKEENEEDQTCSSSELHDRKTRNRKEFYRVSGMQTEAVIIRVVLDIVMGVTFAIHLTE